MHRPKPRVANLLGAFSLATTDRIREAIAEVAPNAGESPAGLVSVATFLDGASIEELSRTLGLSHSATVRLVDKLEQGRLLERRRATDARAVAVASTKRGAQVAERIKEARSTALEELLHPLSSAEQVAFSRLLEKLLEGLATTGVNRGRICRLCDADACGHDTGCCPVTEAAERTP